MSYRLLAILLGCALAASLPVQAGLIGFYPFEGNILDSSGMGNHGTFGPIAPSLTASGYEGAAYQFGLGGANTYLTVPININPSAMPALTMGAWVKVDDASPIRQVLSQDDGVYDRSLGIDWRGGGGWATFKGDGVLAGIPVTMGAWTFVATAYDQDAQNVMLYVGNANGAQTASGSGSLGSGWAFTRIGMNPTFTEYFRGTIDEVFFFNKALSGTELDAIRTCGVRPVPEPISSALFLFGAGAFGLKKFRRKKE